MTGWFDRALSLALLGVAGCTSAPAETTKRASGYVEATEVRVASKVPGRLTTVAVREGARIAQGDAVASISPVDIDLALLRARAERDQAEAQVKLLRAGSRVEDIQQAEAQLAAANADRQVLEGEVATARTDEARFEQLVERRAGSIKQRDDAVARRHSAESRLKAAGDRASAAAAALARLRSGARIEEIEGAVARVAVANAQIAALEHDRGETAIVSPATGIVSSRLVEPGEIVAVGTPLAIIVDLDHAWVNAYVEEPLVPALRVGQSLTVVTDGGDRLGGTIAFIAPRAEFTPRNVQTSAERARLVYRVKVTVDNSRGVLKPGMPVDVQLP